MRLGLQSDHDLLHYLHEIRRPGFHTEDKHAKTEWRATAGREDALPVSDQLALGSDGAMLDARPPSAGSSAAIVGMVRHHLGIHDSLRPGTLRRTGLGYPQPQLLPI